ncbi:acetyltransferase [Pseudoduganella namucuonensis]|uniref:Acetyltransferase n=1 Tax=Pseudoduganella namucuonensis TaxID=1035707 RepID=A0A1I7GZ60_9BURK|nr:acetyltransferase [Pseudoduganella namucuonensis]SFU53727.1 hypothetical protein SAMN05216552_1004210 [Pseudoduganella namucuonensis]
MTHFYAFNGDADGLCALQQLRLAEGPSATGEVALVTGVKRDISLLRRVAAGAGDQVTVLDISLDQNRAALDDILGRGAAVRYFDHHFSGALPASPAFTPHIDEAPDVCTAILVDRHLGGRHRQWAIAAAFGDSLPKVGAAMAAEAGLDAATTAALRDLGTYLNYNAYGDTVADLHVDPHALAGLILPYTDPVGFVRESAAYATLSAGYAADMERARQLRPAHQEPGATVMRMPDEAWAKRAIGVYANELARSLPGGALAILSPNPAGGFVVSLRVPAGAAVPADAFCRRYPTGGGRALAAGVNHLPREEAERFVGAFVDCYRCP